jgi:hypothetical protein
MNPAYRQSLLHLMRDRSTSGMLIRLSWFIAACLVGQVIFGYYFGNPVFGDALMFFLLSSLGYMWCGAYLKSAVLQNQPAHALVPGLRGSLMQLTAGLFLASTLATSVLCWLLLDHFGYGLLMGGVFTLYVMYAQRYQWLNLLPSAVIVASISIVKHPLDELVAAGDRVGEPLVTLIGVVLLALVGTHAMKTVFPRGGDRHWRWYACYTRQLARSQGTIVIGEPGGGVRWLAWLRGPYNAALRGDSRHGASQGRQMMHVLGVKAHDAGAIAYAVVSAVLMACVARYLADKSSLGVILFTSTMMQGMLMTSVLLYACTVSAQAVRFSGEQGLYRLTPAAPAAARFNRVLLGMLLFRCLRLWLISTVAIVCIDVVSLGRLELRGITYALSMLTLPFACLLMRDYASAPAVPRALLPMGMSLLVVAAYIALAVAEQAHPGLPLFWCGSGVALVTVIVLGLRWRELTALPPLLPAGRLAT